MPPVTNATLAIFFLFRMVTANMKRVTQGHAGVAAINYIMPQRPRFPMLPLPSTSEIALLLTYPAYLSH
jgi:hypothetical protein